MLRDGPEGPVASLGAFIAARVRAPPDVLGRLHCGVLSDPQAVPPAGAAPSPSRNADEYLAVRRLVLLFYTPEEPASKDTTAQRHSFPGALPPASLRHDEPALDRSGGSAPPRLPQRLLVFGMTVAEYARAEGASGFTRAYIQHVDSTGLVRPRGAQSALCRSVVRAYLEYVRVVLRAPYVHVFASPKPSLLFSGSEQLAGLKRVPDGPRLCAWWLSILNQHALSAAEPPPSDAEQLNDQPAAPHMAKANEQDLYSSPAASGPSVTPHMAKANGQNLYSSPTAPSTAHGTVDCSKMAGAICNTSHSSLSLPARPSEQAGAHAPPQPRGLPLAYARGGLCASAECVSDMQMMRIDSRSPSPAQRAPPCVGHVFAPAEDRMPAFAGQLRAWAARNSSAGVHWHYGYACCSATAAMGAGDASFPAPFIPLFEDDPKWMHYEAVFLGRAEHAESASAKRRRTNESAARGVRVPRTLAEFFQTLAYRMEFLQEPSALISMRHAVPMLPPAESGASCADLPPMIGLGDSVLRHAVMDQSRAIGGLCASPCQTNSQNRGVAVHDLCFDGEPAVAAQALKMLRPLSFATTDAAAASSTRMWALLKVLGAAVREIGALQAHERGLFSAAALGDRSLGHASAAAQHDVQGLVRRAAPVKSDRACALSLLQS